jgi:hypothetical protein
MNVDWTPPAPSAEVRDGLGPDENTTPIGTQLSANWDPTTDPHSDLLTYEYAIGTAPGTPDIVNWTPAGLTTSVTHTGLSLTDGQTYYFGVRAVNNAGLTSTPPGPMASSTPNPSSTMPEPLTVFYLQIGRWFASTPIPLLAPSPSRDRLP